MGSLDPLQQRINALNGGTPLPQADTMTMATKLLGADLASRYGDVLGARPTGIGDIARDFSIGVMSGDPMKATKLKDEVYANYRGELAKAENANAAREDQARQTLTAWNALIEEVRTMPRELRKAYLEEQGPKIGVDITSPVVKQALIDIEKHKNFDELLSSPEVKEIQWEDPIRAVEQLKAIGADGKSALQAVAWHQDQKKTQLANQNTVADTARKYQLANRPVASRTGLKGKLGPIEEELAFRAANGGKGKYHTFAGRTDDDLRMEARKGTPRAANPTREILNRALAGQASPGTASTGVSVKRLDTPNIATPAPVGLPQAAPVGLGTATTTGSVSTPPEYNF